MPASPTRGTLGGRLGAGFELARRRPGRGDPRRASRYDYRERGDSDVLTAGIAWASDLGRDNHLRLEGGSYSVGLEHPPARRSGEPFERQSDTGGGAALQFAQDRRLFHWSLGASHDISPGAGLGRAVTADNAFHRVSTAAGRRLTLGLDGNASRQRDLGDPGGPSIRGPTAP